MKTLRYRIGDQVKPGILDQNKKIRDASSIVPDWDDQNITVEKLNEVKQIDISSLPIVDNHDGIAPCVCKKSVGKFICIGLNYSDHAEETGLKVPPEPIIFSKATSAIIGPNDNVEKPKSSKKFDHEIEVALIIGKEGKYIKKEEALDYIFGFSICNDYSERDWQKNRNGQWIKGKSIAGNLGPYLVTKDEIKNFYNMRLQLILNGEIRQDGNTSQLIFNFEYLVSYISQFLRLYPGTIITTGTPSGTIMEMDKPEFLKSGDKLHLKIDGLGEQIHEIIDE